MVKRFAGLVCSWILLAAEPSVVASFAGTSNRGFYSDFKKVTEAADVVIEVLDARDPLACRSLEVEQRIRSSGVNKKIILLLNKIGMVIAAMNLCADVGIITANADWTCLPMQMQKALGNRNLSMRQTLYLQSALC